MRTAFDTTVRLDHTTERVWTALTDWSRLEHWMPGVVSASGPTDGATGEELTLTMTRGERVSTITVWDPPNAVAFRSSTGPVTAEYRYELRPSNGESTDARIVGRCAVDGPMRLLGPLVRRTLRRTDGDQLDRLRALLDADT